MNDNGTNGTLASNREAMDRFLAKLAESGNITASAKAAGVPRTTVYRWREKFKTFAAEWDDALEQACDILEAEAWRRALNEQSDRLLMFLLKAHRPERFTERTETAIKAEIDGAVRLTWPDGRIAEPP